METTPTGIKLPRKTNEQILPRISSGRPSNRDDDLAGGVWGDAALFSLDV